MRAKCDQITATTLDFVNEHERHVQAYPHLTLPVATNPLDGLVSELIQSYKLKLHTPNKAAALSPKVVS